jgi:two-component system, LytTR family, response regulator
MLPLEPERSGTSGVLRVVIVDDEPLARDCMRIALEKATDVTIVAECSDGVDAVEAIRAHLPDVVFLDVQMPGLDGFGVVEQIGAHAMPAVVFVTAYDAHAIRAFEVHALDYVLKPFADARILAALERARVALRERQLGDLGRRLASVIDQWYAPPGVAAEKNGHGVPADGTAGDNGDDAGGSVARDSYITRFAVRDDGRVRFVQAVDVDWIEADHNYIILHVGEVKHRLRATIRNVVEELDPKRFVRIHRSVVVNVERIREIQSWFGGDYVAILRNGAKLKVSRMRASQLLRPMA